jgi:hypothetical protein
VDLWSKASVRVIIDEGVINELLSGMLDQALRAVIVITYISKSIVFTS